MEEENNKNKHIKINKESFVTINKGDITQFYEVIKKIGEGSYGKIYKVKNKQSGDIRAMKQIMKSKIPNIEKFQNEIKILSMVDHPNIVRLFEVIEDDKYFNLLQELCTGGELLSKVKYISNEKEIAKIFKQIMSAIAYCHEKGIVHRDMKLENILFVNESEDSPIKIIDFGLSVLLGKKDINKENDPNELKKYGYKRMTTKVGTIYYMSPEILKGSYDEKCDIWACGVIFYILLCGYPPFNGESDEEIFIEILKGQLEFPEEDWSEVTKEAKDLIKKMLTKDPNERISALDSMKEPWFKKFEEKTHYDKKLAKNVLNNMKKFKKHRTLEKTIISFIINQLVKKDERQELEKQFKDWDTNGDGVLSREEIINGYKKTYGKVDENEIDNMIKSIDLDGNGVIDYNEFLACSMNKEKILRNDNLKICFNEFDTDGSGKISVDEISAIFKRGNKDNEEDLEAFKNMIKEADENGDGEISFEEFQDIMNRFFI